MADIDITSLPLAINYSPEAADLFAQGEIEFDLYKCPDWPDLIDVARQQAPIYVHFGLTAGDGRLGMQDFAALAEMRAQTETQFINLHLVTHTTTQPEDAKSWNQAVQEMYTDIQYVVQAFGAKTVIVEHFPMYRIGREYVRPAVDARVLNQLVRETGVGFLLDLAHARLTAATLGLDEIAYLESLPVWALRELHIAGVGPVNGVDRDHLPMTPADWRVVEYSLAQIRAGRWPQPHVVALEYGGVGVPFAGMSQREVILRDVTHLYDLMHA